jgi:hypothetical protein
VLDVLGYRRQLEMDRKAGTLSFQSRLSSALAVFDSVNDAVFRVQAISDTVILTCGRHSEFPEFLRLLRRIFVSFLKEGLFVRGGVSYSRHFQSGRLTYSHAVAAAHELESTRAGYPRIVLDTNIVSMYETGKNLPAIRSCGLLSVENGVYFVDVLTPDNWDEVYQCAKHIYEISADALHSDETAFGKHLRFERYLLSSPHAPTQACPFTDNVTAA